MALLQKNNMILLFNHAICSKTVVIQMVINPRLLTTLLLGYNNKTMVNFRNGWQTPEERLALV